MMKFRYDTNGRWFKGNTHIHSTASDGHKTFPEIAEMYASADYDFLFRTDHWVCSDASQDAVSYPLLWLDGIELDGHDSTGAYMHVVCLGRVEGLSRDDGFEACLHSAREQGALTVLAHPHWCGNTLEDVRRWDFDGVEIYNHVCHWLNGKSNGLVYWDAALMQNSRTLAFAVDDAHLRPEHPGWNGGWLMVNAPECSSDALIDSIRQGNYYSSCGPEIHALSFDDGHLYVETSPVKYARLVGPRSKGLRLGSMDDDADLLQEFSFTIPGDSVPSDWSYVYLEIEDAAGRRAWTNSLLTDD